MLGFPCVPGLRSQPDQQSRSVRSMERGRRRGFHAAQLWRIPVYGEDKEKSRTQIVGRQ